MQPPPLTASGGVRGSYSCVLNGSGGRLVLKRMRPVSGRFAFRGLFAVSSHYGRRWRLRHQRFSVCAVIAATHADAVAKFGDRARPAFLRAEIIFRSCWVTIAVTPIGMV